MEIYIATIGAYEDERILGWSLTKDGALKLINRIRATPDYEGYADDEVDSMVYGPWIMDEAYDYLHQTIQK